MSTEELLNIRFKLIAGYPGCEIEVGSIIHMGSDYEQQVGYLTLIAYSHLFQKLEWWQERKPEEMPRYLKDKSGNKVYSVYKHFTCTYPTKQADNAWFDDPNCWLREHDYAQNYSFYLPATEEEFNSYQSINTSK